MYNFGFNAVLPFTAAVNGYNRLLNALIGTTILLFLILAGFSAIESDFVNIMPVNSNNPGYMFLSNECSVCTIDQKQGLSKNRGSVAGEVWGKGMILCPIMPDDLFVGSSSNLDCDKSKGIAFEGVAFDSTIYLSSDMVDEAPKLIWMIYPDLSKAAQTDVSSVQLILSILVDYSGKAIDVSIADETLIAHSAKQIILESVKTSVFKPAQKNNQSVTCWVQFPLEVEVEV